MSKEIHTAELAGQFSRTELPRTIDIEGVSVEIASLNFAASNERVVALVQNQSRTDEEQKLYEALWHRRQEVINAAVEAHVFDGLYPQIKEMYEVCNDVRNASERFGLARAADKHTLAEEMQRVEAITVVEPVDDLFNGVVEYERERLLKMAKETSAQAVSTNEVSFRKAGEKREELAGNLRTGKYTEAEDVRAGEELVAELEERREALAAEFMASDAPEAKAVLQKIDDVHQAVAETNEHFDTFGAVSVREKGELLQAIVTSPPETQDETYAGVCDYEYQRRIQDEGLREYVDTGIKSVAELSYKEAREARTKTEELSGLSAEDEEIKTAVLQEATERMGELRQKAEEQGKLRWVEERLDAKRRESLDSQIVISQEIFPDSNDNALPEATRHRLAAQLRRDQENFQMSEVPDEFEGVRTDYYREGLERLIGEVEAAPSLAEDATYVQAKEALVQARIKRQEGQEAAGRAHTVAQGRGNEAARVRAEETEDAARARERLAEEAEAEFEARRGRLVAEANDRHLLDGIIDNVDRVARIAEVTELQRRCADFGVPKEAADDLKRRLLTMAEHPPISAVPVDVTHQGIREDLWREGSDGLGRILPADLTGRRGVVHLADNLTLAVGDPTRPETQTYEACRQRREAARIALRRQKIDLATNHDDQVQAEIRRERAAGRRINEAQAIDNLTRNYVEQQAVTELRGITAPLEAPLRDEFEDRFGPDLGAFQIAHESGETAALVGDLLRLFNQTKIRDAERARLSPAEQQKREVLHGLFLDRLESMGLTIRSINGVDRIIALENIGRSPNWKDGVAFNQAWEEGNVEQTKKIREEQDAAAEAEARRLAEEAAEVQRQVEERTRPQREADAAEAARLEVIKNPELKLMPTDAETLRRYVLHWLDEIEKQGSYLANVEGYTIRREWANLAGKLMEWTGDPNMEPQLAQQIKARLRVLHCAQVTGSIPGSAADAEKFLKGAFKNDQQKAFLLRPSDMEFLCRTTAHNIPVVEAWKILQETAIVGTDITVDGRVTHVRFMGKANTEEVLTKIDEKMVTDLVARIAVGSDEEKKASAERALRIAKNIARATKETNVWDFDPPVKDTYSQAIYFRRSREASSAKGLDCGPINNIDVIPTLVSGGSLFREAKTTDGVFLNSGTTADLTALSADANVARKLETIFRRSGLPFGPDNTFDVGRMARSNIENYPYGRLENDFYLSFISGIPNVYKAVELCLKSDWKRADITRDTVEEWEEVFAQVDPNNARRVKGSFVRGFCMATIGNLTLASERGWDADSFRFAIKLLTEGERGKPPFISKPAWEYIAQVMLMHDNFDYTAQLMQIEIQRSLNKRLKF